jgi:hypothetical protein
MMRALVPAMFALVACAGGKSQAPAPRVAPAATCAASVDLRWVERTTELHVGEVSTGHFGMWEMHADMHREDDVFLGMLSATFRRRRGEAPAVAARELRVTAAEIVALLTSFRDAIRVPRDANARKIYVSDSSRTDGVSIEAIMRESVIGARPAPRHVQFFLDDGQDKPQPWRVRGCEETLPYDGQTTVTKAYAAFAEKLGRNALYAQLEAEARRDAP